MGAEDESNAVFSALVDYEDPYVQPLILSTLKSSLPSASYALIDSISEKASTPGPILQFRSYEAIDFELALEKDDCLINAYVIRKALIRKHYLSTTIANWVVKHPDSVLKKHFRPAVDFELDYAEFLDDALVEAFELRESFEKNADLEPRDREWWILKPGMSDRGQGIRLFSTEKELQSIFEEWEVDEQPDDEDKEAQDSAIDTIPGLDISEKTKKSDYVITSQLRHFIAQPYIHPPLLLPSSENRKFHIRTYVLAVGALQVYVYKPMLALFATEPYAPPWEDTDLKAHLTNTCLQETGEREGSVRLFWELEDAMPDSALLKEPWKEDVFSQICAITGEVFEAASRGMMVHFQTLPNAFELFGLDFMVDKHGTSYLLEVNAFPDFKQTGDDLKQIIEDLFADVVEVAIKPFFAIEGGKPQGTATMHSVLDIDLGRR
ncbi:putative tubulin--tyrosine ligase C12B10.04 [Venturia nashicola]|uniref:Putative tubulin--tyrosine ligase C12B10.04 n=1 Tax=Venturia nashicola TaxID=86259 RepID=A0A4Z1PHF2_9PEZI|nr:putative tubulin--tyrosine ligase C12B10.04 [Venturia nashicola]